MSDVGPTQPLVELVPPDPGSRRAVGISMMLLLASTVVWTFVCAGTAVLEFFVSRPSLVAVSFVGAVGLGLPYLVITLWLDRNEKEPAWLVLSALAWGAFIATSTSLFLNGALGDPVLHADNTTRVAEALHVSLTAPVVEEICKAGALYGLYLLFRDQLDNVLDGVIYGALIGLGYAVFENFLYYVETGQVGTALALICIRGLITAPGTHACFSAITGAGLGLFRISPANNAQRWAYPVLGLLAAILVHVAWNAAYAQAVGVFATDFTSFYLGLPAAVVVLQLPFLLLILVVAGFALRHETEVIATHLSDEEPPVLHPNELSYLVPARRRSLRSALLLFRGDLAAYRLVRRRNDLLVELAFEKWHGTRDGEEDRGPHIRELRGQLSALASPPP